MKLLPGRFCMRSLHIELYLLSGRSVLLDLHAALVEEHCRGGHTVCAVVFVAVVDNSFYPRLNDSFRALIARKKRNIERTAGE